jgi:archaetidylinositol phosphate synthase
MIDTKLRKYVQKAFDFMARPLIAAGLSPTQVTLAAAGLGILGAVFLTFGTFRWRMAAIAVVTASTLLDILDGTVARNTGRSSPLGAFLDLILDRVVEAAIIIAFAFTFPATHWPGMFFLAFVIINFSAFLLAGSMFPNAGKKSIHYEGGLVERTETFILFGLMAVFPAAAPWMLWLFNVLMAGTAVIRFIRIVRYARENGLDGRVPQQEESSE